MATMGPRMTRPTGADRGKALANKGKAACDFQSFHDSEEAGGKEGSHELTGESGRKRHGEEFQPIVDSEDDEGDSEEEAGGGDGVFRSL